jgi:hypothetical protein
MNYKQRNFLLITIGFIFFILIKNSFQNSKKNKQTDKTDVTIVSNWVDSPKIKQLKPFFRIKKDEYSKTSEIMFKPKSAPTFVNSNGLYCYFITENEIPSNFRFRLQYYSDDWIFFRQVNFLIDGKVYEYYPFNIKTDCGDGGRIWEWFDDKVSGCDKDLIYALANAKKATNT